MTVASEGSQRRSGVKDTGRSIKNLPGGTSAVVPPDPMPNSEVKRRSADGSVGPPHARVGHRQALIPKKPEQKSVRVFSFMDQWISA